MNFDLPLRLLTIYAAKAGLDHDQIVFRSKWADNFNFNLNGQRYFLYIKRSESHPPSWHTFFEGHVDKSLLGETSSAGAVLLTDVGGRTFVLTFGISKQMLQPNALEEGFGLRVVLNTVEKVRSIDKDTFDAIGGKTRTQASFDVAMGDFGFDAERDLLKVVVGTPPGKPEELGLKMAGVDSLKVLIPFKLDRLPDILRRLQHQATLSTYKTQFGFVDQIKHITDRSIIDRLDEEVVEKLRARSFASDVRLCFPNLLDLAEIPNFRYKPKPITRQNYFDISIDSFLNTAVDSRWALSVSMLQSRYVYKVDENDVAIPIATVYRCLNAEIDFGGVKYLLISGRWYKVEDTFLEDLNDFYMNRVDRYEVALPPFGDINWKPANSKEKVYSETVYNQAVVKANANFIHYDRRFIYPVSGQKFEFCDLYSEAYAYKDLIHVKRAKNSQTLSNVFAQATVSAESFMDSADIRTKWNSLLPDLWKIKDCTGFPDTSKYRVVFALINEKGHPPPFFAKVNLRQACKKLRNWRFLPCIAEIEVNPAWQKKNVITSRKK